jgi:hypothetical protein
MNFLSQTVLVQKCSFYIWVHEQCVCVLAVCPLFVFSGLMHELARNGKKGGRKQNHHNHIN